MAQQSRDWRRSGQSRDDQSRQGRNPQWNPGSDFAFDEEQQGYPRGAERNQDSQYGRSYEGGRMESGIRGTGGSGYEDEYRGSSQGGYRGGYGGGSSGSRDETRFGSSHEGREGRDYPRRGYSGESRGQSWGDREQFSGGDYEQFGGRGGGYYGTSGSYGSLGPRSNSYGSSGSQGDWLSRLEGNENYGGQRGGSMAPQQRNFRGRGPKGYQRSDERIKEAVCEELCDDPQIDASEISVSVSSGTVTLTGTVNDRRTKYEVEEMVCACSGVQEVDNQLRVQSQPGQSATWQTGSQSTNESSGGSRSTTQGSSSDGGSGRGSSSH